MKKLMLLAMLTGIAFKGFSVPKKVTKDVEVITQINPYKTTTAELEQALGKPDKEYTAQEQKLWEYKKGNIALMIDINECGTVKQWNFNSNEKVHELWKGDNAKSLLTGKINYKEVVALLGNPQHMSVNRNVQKLQYQYEDNILQLHFKDGVLLKYELHGKG